MRTVGSRRIRIVAVVAGIFTLADVDVSFSTLEGPVDTVVEFAGTDCPGPSEHLGMYVFEIPAPTGEGVLLGTYPIARDGSSSGEFAIPTHLAGLQARTVTPGDYRLIGDCDTFALGRSPSCGPWWSRRGHAG